MGGAHVDAAELVDGAGADLVAGELVDGHGLAGDGTLVDARGAGDHDTVDGDRLAGEHADDLVELGVVGVDHAGLAAGLDHAGLARGELDEPLDALLRALDRELLEQPAELHDEGDLPGREVLAGGHRGDERERDEQVCLDV